MLAMLVAIFVIAYAAIALEHPIKINKSASALIAAGLLWTVYAVLSGDSHQVAHQLNESLASTAQIVFFLMGAMTIVEVVDAHSGFEVITSRIKACTRAGSPGFNGCTSISAGGCQRPPSRARNQAWRVGKSRVVAP